MNNIIGDFVKKQEILKDTPIVRGLYIRMCCTELFILEEREWKNQRRTFVFEFDCGHFVSCKTEVNTMEKYLVDIPNVCYAEYVSYI